MLLVALVGAGLVAAPRAEAHRTTVRATGQAVIEKGNAPLAEAQAAAAAYRHAVEEIAASLGAPKAGRDARLDQLLYERAARFVTNSSLVTRRVHGATLELELQVELEVDAVQTVIRDRAALPRPPVNRAALHGAMWVLVTQRARPDRTT